MNNNIEDNKLSIKDKNRFKFANKFAGMTQAEIEFEFLKNKDPDMLKVIMKKFLRKAKMPFRDFDTSKKEYFDKLSEFSDEIIDFENDVHQACEDYIKDIDPKAYDKNQEQRKHRNNWMTYAMLGLLENNNRKNNMKKQYTKKQIQEAIAYWKKQLRKLNESHSLNKVDKNVAQILSTVSMIDKDTLSDPLRNNMVNVIIPNNVTEIDDEAFAYCDNLETIIIPDSVTSIGYNAFYESEYLTRIVFSSNSPLLNEIKNGDCEENWGVNINQIVIK